MSRAALDARGLAGTTAKITLKENRYMTMPGFTAEVPFNEKYFVRCDVTEEFRSR
jgi:hypothetical protein